MYKCALTGKDLITDAYKKTEYKNADGIVSYWLFEGDMQAESSEIDDSLIGGNKSEEVQDEGTEDAVKVVASLTRENLDEFVWDKKKDFKPAMKKYLTNAAKWLEEKEGSTDEDKALAEKLKAENKTNPVNMFAADVQKRWNDLQWFTTAEDYDKDGVFCGFWADGYSKGDKCYMMVLPYALEEEKY